MNPAERRSYVSLYGLRKVGETSANDALIREREQKIKDFASNVLGIENIQFNY